MGEKAKQSGVVVFVYCVALHFDRKLIEKWKSVDFFFHGDGPEKGQKSREFSSSLRIERENLVHACTLQQQQQQTLCALTTAGAREILQV
jgi:hypothetical protein